jgi:hypothetical protein
MWTSILFGLVIFLTILLSGWLRVLFSLVSFSFGQKIPFLYFFLGISYGYGCFNDKMLLWPGFVVCLILAFFLISSLRSQDEINGFPSTVTSSSSGFILGGLIGLVSGLIVYLINLYFL